MSYGFAVLLYLVVAVGGRATPAANAMAPERPPAAVVLAGGGAVRSHVAALERAVRRAAPGAVVQRVVFPPGPALAGGGLARWKALARRYPRAAVVVVGFDCADATGLRSAQGKAIAWGAASWPRAWARRLGALTSLWPRATLILVGPPQATSHNQSLRCALLAALTAAWTATQSRVSFVDAWGPSDDSASGRTSPKWLQHLAASLATRLQRPLRQHP